MEKIFIYSIEFPVRNIKYIGCSKEPKKRFDAHIGHANRGSKQDVYDWIRFVLSQNQKPILNIIDEVPEDEWDFWEQHYISLYKTFGFDLTNMAHGGKGTSGYKYSKKQREARSKQQIGEKNHRWKTSHTEEWKQNHSAKLKKRYETKPYPLKGVPLSKAHVEKLISSAAKIPRTTCVHCNKTLKHFNHDKWHGDNCKKHPNYIPEKHTCDLCNKTYTSKSLLNRHLRGARHINNLNSTING